MAQIKGTNVVAPVVPLDTADTHPSHEARYGKGGYRTVATTAERDAIPAPRREAGMLVHVVADGGSLWQLGADLTTWTEFETGDGAPDAHAASHGSAGSDPVTLAISQVTGLQAALDGKQVAGSYAALVHTHVIADVTGLQTALDGKQAAGSYAAASHTHDASAITTGTLSASRLPASVVQRVGSANAVTVGPILSLYPIAPEDVTEISVLSMAVWDGAGYETVFEVRGDGFLTFGTIDWANVINVPATYAPSAHKASHATGGSDALTASDIGAASLSHQHSATDVTSGTFDIARIPTGTSSTTVCIGNDSRLSDARTPLSHTHGNISNAGAIGSTSGQVVVTTTSGVLTTAATVTASQLPIVMEQTQAIGNSGSTKTLSLATGSVQTVTLSASCTFTMPTATAGASITLILTQGSNYTATFTGVKWAGGTAPTITATTNAIDILIFVSDGTNWYGVASQKFS